MNYTDIAKIELASMAQDARQMLQALSDKYQRDETILFIRHAEELMARDVVTPEDMSTLREHY